MGKFILCLHVTSFNMVLTFTLINADNTGNKDEDIEMPHAYQPHPAPPAPINQDPPGREVNEIFTKTNSSKYYFYVRNLYVCILSS